MGYTQLPEDVEEKIATEHLTTFRQLVAFSAVCRSWRSTAFDLYNRCRFNFPGILVVTQTDYSYDSDSDSDNGNNSVLYSQGPYHQFHPISTIFNFTGSVAKPPPPPPRLCSSPHDCRTTRMMHLGEESESKSDSSAVVDLGKCHCLASKDGWLVLRQLRHGCFSVRIFLLNPVTGVSILLPPLRSHGFRSFTNLDYVVLSSSPDKEDCHVIVLSDCLYDPQVAWCKVGGGGGGYCCWKFTRRDSKFFRNVASACFFGGRLYVADSNTSSLYVFDNLINVRDETVGPPPPPTVHSSPFSSAMRLAHCKVEALELGGELIIVLRSGYKDLVTFQVYKLVAITANKKPRYSWARVRSLDGHAVLLGTHHSCCVPAKNNGMIRGDHIYYMMSSCSHCEYYSYHQRRRYMHRDYGVFSVEDEKLVERSHLPPEYPDNVWFSPMPWDIRKRLIKDKKEAKVRHASFEALSLGDKSV